MGKRHHIFVDFENVQTLNPELPGLSATSLTLLIGPTQNLNGTFVEQLMALTKEVRLLRIGRPGKNALDFVLAYELGRLAMMDPAASFHVISKDKGYDSLLEHLQARSIDAHRHNDYSDLPCLVSSPEVKTVQEKAKSPAKPKPGVPQSPKKAKEIPLWKMAVNHLKSRPRSRPKKKKGLANALAHLPGGPKSPQASDALIEELATKGHLKIEETGAVTYTLG